MKKTLLLLAVSITAFVSYSQKSEIALWMSQNPTIYVISEANFDNLSQEHKDRLQDKIIVYKKEITLEQLVAFSPLKSAVVLDDISAGKDADANEIKQWLGEHSDIKIIPRSYFDTLSQTERTEYEQIGALFLLGEQITIQDIRNY